MGEVLGLRLGDVDTLRSAVHIRRTAQKIPGLGRIVKDPKTDAGRRTVVLPRQAMEAIAADAEAFGRADTGELVTDRRGRPARRARVSEAWQQAKAAVGVNPAMDPHDLRHHAATLMAQMPGINHQGADGPHRSLLSSRRCSFTSMRRPSVTAKWPLSSRIASTPRGPLGRALRALQRLQ